MSEVVAELGGRAQFEASGGLTLASAAAVAAHRRRLRRRRRHHSFRPNSRYRHGPASELFALRLRYRVLRQVKRRKERGERWHSGCRSSSKTISTAAQADETVLFGLDGAEYEVDLSSENAQGLRDALAPWVGVARRTGGRASARPRRRRGRPRPAAAPAPATSAPGPRRTATRSAAAAASPPRSARRTRRLTAEPSAADGCALGERSFAQGASLAPGAAADAAPGADVPRLPARESCARRHGVVISTERPRRLRTGGRRVVRWIHDARGVCPRRLA